MRIHGGLSQVSSSGGERARAMWPSSSGLALGVVLALAAILSCRAGTFGSTCACDASGSCPTSCGAALGDPVSSSGDGTPVLDAAGGYDFVDVRDVARGHILALERGRTGENYLLSGSRLKVREVMQILAEEAGEKAPRLCVPLWLAAAVAWAPVLWERVTGRRAIFTPYAIRTLGIRYTISQRKAVEELGFSPMPAEQSLRDAWKWMSEDPDSPFTRAERIPRPGRVVVAPHADAT